MLIAQPGRMGPLRLRNRIIMGPMGTNYGTTDGFSTERDKLYYGERARGGAAMIITEAMVITAGRAQPHQLAVPVPRPLHSRARRHRGRDPRGRRPRGRADQSPRRPAQALGAGHGAGDGVRLAQPQHRRAGPRDHPAGDRGDPARLPRFRAPALSRRLRRGRAARRQRLSLPAVPEPAHQPARGPLRRIDREPDALPDGDGGADTRRAARTSRSWCGSARPSTARAATPSRT